MSDPINGKPPTAFWIIGGVALVWNLIGAMLFYMQVSATDEVLKAAYGEAQYEYLTAIPGWVTTAYGVAVISGVLGCILLLMRKTLAIPLFIVSLVAIIAQDTYSFILSDAIAAFGMGVIAIPTVVLIIAIGLVFYSRSSKDKGWLD